MERVRAMMRDKDYAACLLFDPNNQRYATGSRNMSYISEVNGEEGVKLEEQLLVTQQGIERISAYPFDDQLLPPEI